MRVGHFGVEHLVVEHLVVEHFGVEHLVVEHLVVEHLSVKHLVVEHFGVEHLVVEHLVVEHLSVCNGSKESSFVNLSSLVSCKRSCKCFRRHNQRLFNLKETAFQLLISLTLSLTHSLATFFSLSLSLLHSTFSLSF